MAFIILLIMCIVTCNPVLCFESLTPYVNKHGSRLHHRAIRDCHLKEFGTVPFEVFPSVQSLNNSLPFLEYKRFIRHFKSNLIRGHYAATLDPLKTLAVLEPNEPGGCHLSQRQSVAETAKQMNCIIAVNAGYFNTHNGSCLGNVVSNGKIVHDSGGIQNAHFGIKQDGQIFSGYVSHEALRSENFQQLVGGVIWLVRNSTNFVNVSKFLECESTEETGPLDLFVNITSARTAVGHNKEGHVVIVQIDGKSLIDGISLWDFAELLIDLGLVNAINLDGGGSATFVVNGTTVNYPYDPCPSDTTFSCDRKVSTVLCLHSPTCVPADCNGHGRCHYGKCECEDDWLPPHCDHYLCSNCSGHGKCIEKGCECDTGFEGKACESRVKQANSTIQTKEETINMKEIKQMQIALIMLTIVSSVSIAASLILIYCSCSCTCSNKRCCTKKKKSRYRSLSAIASDMTISDSSDDDSVPMKFINKI